MCYCGLEERDSNIIKKIVLGAFFCIFWGGVGVGLIGIVKLKFVEWDWWLPLLIFYYSMLFKDIM